MKAYSWFAWSVLLALGTDIKDALKRFVDCPGFKIQLDELKSATPFCVIERDGLRINLFGNKQLAKEHNPEFRLITTDIDEVYKKGT